MKTTIIYLIGHPGTGKYTIAREIAKAGYIVCDNQLINNPIFTLLNYDGLSSIPQIGWEAIDKIRKAVYEFMSEESANNYILTSCLYEDDGDRECFKNTKEMAAKRGSVFIPVKLLISKEEHLRRITQASRRERWKSIDPKDAEQTEDLIQINHPNLLELDVTTLSAHEAAKIILEFVKKIRIDY